ncbi:MAG: response regulator [Prosthecobacter sp.]|uniref:hybrid sensor histidine kinase/response regulator n=1 Tax=Prosthecobacter sp. TaxID=1965333 RepID=UPI0025E2CF36|nr:response regulator [Prosthecobacter sp.]MCF7786845.1 response regulator [Prosthecobacter sp.]
MSATHQTVKILVVDDDPGLTRLIERELRREGYQTAVAGSGAEAADWLKQHRADLLLLDLKLPDIEGPALIEMMASMGRSVPFIIITGQGDERVAVDMMKCGALDYLVKDVNFIEFVPTVVRRALSQLDKEQRLAAAEHDRQRLEREILRISEREQQRIGQDLHDDLGQQLTALCILTSVLTRTLAGRAAPEVPAAARISDLMKEAVAMTRSLARGLHPVAAEPDGLMLALHDLTTRMISMFRIGCQFDCAVPVQVNDNTAATHLYRIAQEAVSNGVKHGHAQHVRIGLSSDAENLTLTVKDDGCGISSLDPKRQGMGLRIMHYRADMIGARVSIANQPAGGTCVTCTLPVPSSAVSPAAPRSRKPLRKAPATAKK